MFRILAVTLLAGASTAAWSAEPWFLMARHGECVEVQSLKRKVPELGSTGDPYSFVDRMRQAGHAAVATEMPGTAGKAVEVRVPERGLAMVFARRELCQEFLKR